MMVDMMVVVIVVIVIVIDAVMVTDLVVRGSVAASEEARSTQG